MIRHRILIFTLIAFLFVVIFPFPIKAANKRIEIDLTRQRLYAIQGNTKIYSFTISSGKSRWPTPTGSFSILTKLRYKDMRGGSKLDKTYYFLPKVPYTMFFYKGYAIHGTYWHSNFGHPMSHGCINLKTADAHTLYNWAEIGTLVKIYGRAPRK